MVNVAEAKYSMADEVSNRFDVVKSTSEIFKPRAVTDYEKKKAAEMAAIHKEIHRVMDDAQRIDMI